MTKRLDIERERLAERREIVKYAGHRYELVKLSKMLELEDNSIKVNQYALIQKGRINPEVFWVPVASLIRKENANGTRDMAKKRRKASSNRAAKR